MEILQMLLSGVGTIAIIVGGLWATLRTVAFVSRTNGYNDDLNRLDRNIREKASETSLEFATRRITKLEKELNDKASAFETVDLRRNLDATLGRVAKLEKIASDGGSINDLWMRLIKLELIPFADANTVAEIADRVTKLEHWGWGEAKPTLNTPDAKGVVR